MSINREPYTMGYGPAATAIMAMRTAKSHAAFFFPYLKSGMSLLDCGCGPGTITLGFAEFLASGHVIGTEIEVSQVALATESASKQNVSNARFEVASIYKLPFEDSSFDAVFISAVMGNLKEPIRGLVEAHRVLKPGGVIGLKEFDHGGDIIFPLDPDVNKFLELYLRLRRENGHDPESGRKIGGYLLDAGYGDLKMSACYEVFSEPKHLRGLAELNIGLLLESWGVAFTSRGWATADDIKQMSEAWLRFAAQPGAFCATTWVEAVARKPEVN